MDSQNTMSLNEIFDRLKEKLETIIEAKKMTRNSKSQTQQVLELIDYSQFISAKPLEGYLVEYELFERVFKILMNEPPSFLSSILIRTTIAQSNIFNQYNTLIRSARKITKKNQLAYNFQITLQKLLDGYRGCITTTTQQQSIVLKSRKDVIQSSVKLISYSGFNFYELVEYYSRLGSNSQKWWVLNLEKDTKFTINKQIARNLRDSFTSFDKREFFLTDLIKSSNFTTNAHRLLKILNKQDLTEEFEKISSELLWVYSQMGVIQPIQEKVKSKETKTKLKRLISNAYFELVTELFRNTKYENVVDEPLKILSKIALVCENGIQEELQKQNLPPHEMEREYKIRISPLLGKFSIISEWLLSLISYLHPYENVAQKYEEIVEDLTVEIKRKRDEFEDYSDVLYETNTRASADQEIEVVLQILDDKVSSYENTTLRLLEDEIPQIQQITEIMKNFQKEFDEIHTHAKNIFKKYENENINIYDAVQRWEETFFAEKHRAEFLVTKMLSILIEKFQSVIKKEQSSTDFAVDEKNISLMLSPGVLNAQTLTDEQIHNQMQYIDKKLKDIEEMKSEYIQTKISYKALLEKRLEKKGDIKSKICVICHKKVDMVSEEYIKCEFCGRLSHYLCSAWWLEKYNSCPVCGNVYLQPGSDLYDSDQVEK